MPPTKPAVGRRHGSGRKGDDREKSILDAAEDLLAREGFEAMTVEAIARGAGISRASLYFYFGSKQDVLTALVGRTMEAINADARAASTNTSVEPTSVVLDGIATTESFWREHGVVMQAAIEVGQTIPAIKELWSTTLERSVHGYSAAFVRAGFEDGPGPSQSVSLSRSLCYMVERSFYWSHATTGTDKLHEVTETCQQIWLATLSSIGDGPDRS